jgi:6-phosphofructokinase 1
MLTIKDESNKNNYKWSIGSTKLDNVANVEKMLPGNYVKASGIETTSACNRYISNLIKGENYPSYNNGYPKYANLKCKTIRKKLKSYKL